MNQHAGGARPRSDVSFKTRPKKRRRPPRGAMHFPGLDKCSVCLDPAGPHIYYGARACLPCRAFFKRSVEQNQVYICFGDSNCVVTFRGRKTCKYCRFQACLRGGMKESYVLNDDQRKRNDNQRKPRETLSQEEATSIQRLAGISRIFDKSKIGILSNWKIILQEIIRWILFQKGISIQSKMFLEREMEKKTKRFLRKLPFFISLPAADKDIILEKNVPLGVLFQKCTFFNPSYNLFVQLSALLGQAEVEKLQKKLLDYGIGSGQLEGNTFTYFDLFFLPETNFQSLERFEQIQSQVSYWPKDCYEYVLLLLIILFDPRHIRSPEKVYGMQTHFSQLLFKYLLTTSSAGDERSKALVRFGSGIECISKCTELHDVFTNNLVNEPMQF